MMNASLAVWNGNTVYLTNLTATTCANQTMTASVSIAGGTNFVPYDIWSTTNLSESIVNFQWNWLGIGYTGYRYTFTNQPENQTFYALAEPRRTMVVGFGDDTVGECDVPYGLTNALAVAGSDTQGLALLKMEKWWPGARTPIPIMSRPTWCEPPWSRVASTLTSLVDQRNGCGLGGQPVGRTSCLQI